MCCLYVFIENNELIFHSIRTCSVIFIYSTSHLLLSYSKNFNRFTQSAVYVTGTGVVRVAPTVGPHPLQPPGISTLCRRRIQHHMSLLFALPAER